MGEKYDIKRVKEIDEMMHNVEEISLEMGEGCLAVSFYNENDKRVRIKFTGFWTIKVTKIDSYDYDKFLSHEGRPYWVCEVMKSSWIEEIEEEQKRNNTYGHWKHMGEPRHYLFVGRDNVVEIIAFNNAQVIVN